MVSLLDDLSRLRWVGRNAPPPMVAQWSPYLEGDPAVTVQSQVFVLSIFALMGVRGVVEREAEATEVVGFDAPAMVVAEPINPAVVELPTMGGDLVRLRIPLSTFISPDFRGSVDEYVVEIESSYQTMRVLDFWPKSEVYTAIEGTVSVESSQLNEDNLQFNLSASYEPLARGSAQGDFQRKSHVQESYQRKPPMQILTSSGTIRRGFGVFFKFRPGPMPVLEGVRDIAILAEVPRGWRADMLQVRMRAVGQGSSYRSRLQDLGEARLWMTTHREGDGAAAAQVRRYVTQERALRSLAASSQGQVQQKSLPTFWHKLGATLDVVEPRIPGD
ncbi:MAG: hypothetical protein KDA45_11055, partial [Planctomycetales bacterium]|nr:hypothetical protein [Planctomycetales bacterium]